MNKENCVLKLVNEIILYYDARSKKHQMSNKFARKLPVLWKLDIVFALVTGFGGMN